MPEDEDYERALILLRGFQPGLRAELLARTRVTEEEFQEAVGILRGITSPMQVRCPLCRAEPGADCVFPPHTEGPTGPGFVHLARWNAVPSLTRDWRELAAT